MDGEVVVEKIKDSEWEVGYNAMNNKYDCMSIRLRSVLLTQLR